MSDDATLQRLCRLVAGFLKSEGYTASLEALQRECRHAKEPEDGLPELMRALEAMELAKRPLPIGSDNPLDVECSHATPQDVTLTLEEIHASNILSIRYHELRRQRFDTSVADYVEERVPCIVTTAADKTIKFSRTSDFEVIELFEPGHGPFLHVAFHPSKPWMAVSAMTGHVFVLNLETRETICERKHAKYAVRVVWDPEGRYLASIGYDKAIQVHDAEQDFKQVWSHSFATNPEGLLFLPDGHLLVSRRDSCHLVVISPADWSIRLVNLNEHDDSHISFSVLDMALHPSGAYISLQTDTDNARILLFPLAGLSLTTTSQRTPIARILFTFAEQSAYSLPRHSWLPDGTAVAVTSDSGLVRIIDVAHGLVRSTIRAHGEAAPGARRPAGGGSGSSVVRDVCALPIGDDGKVRIASVGFDRTIRIAEA